MSSDPMMEIRATFFAECEELMEDVQDTLTSIGDGAADAESINVVFRAVHSIKGGAAAFGFDSLVAFAHRFESVLDALRAGRFAADPAVVKLLFKGADMLQDHIRAAIRGEVLPASADVGLETLEELAGGASTEVAGNIEFTPMGLSIDIAIPDEVVDATATALTPDETRDEAIENVSHWQILFEPHEGLYTSGNEAQLVLRELSALGDARIICDVPDDLTLDETRAETPRLSWRIWLRGQIEREQIESAFEFVTDICSFDVRESAADPDLFAPAFAAQDPASEQTQSSDMAALPSTGAPLPGDPPGSANIATLEFAAAPGSEPGQDSRQSSGAVAPVTVRVDLDKVDRLVNLLGELVVNQSMLAQSVNQAGLGDSEVSVGLDAFTILTRNLQDTVMSIRAQPVKPLFQRMARIVREASSSVGKEVRLITEGDATEVDKTLIERLAEPLTHMIRNAVDHGLEDTERRLSSGKTREGNITLSATHRAGRVLIEVSDDGPGINEAKVRDIAVQRGLISADAALTKNEVYDLLMQPGFSTASSVSALSGRGVGMDVVKSSIEEMGGRLSIESTSGKGSTFSISLPLTLAVLEGMIIRAAAHTFVMPLTSILETIAYDDSKIVRTTGSLPLLHIRGSLVPLFNLSERLGLPSEADASQDGVVLLTVQEDGSRCAWIVDSVIDQRQVVIKRLEGGLVDADGIAAATILGDGQVALILDPTDLAKQNRAEHRKPLPKAG